MKYLPIEDLTFRTKLDAAEVLDRLEENVEPKKFLRATGFFGNKDHKPYEGSITGNAFSISRIIHYRNSFLPIIKGQVENNVSSAKIHIKMRLNKIAMAVLIFLCLAVLTAFISLSMATMDEGGFGFINIIPLGMFFVLYIATTLGFKYESKKSIKYFTELFEAEIEEGV